MIRLRPYKPCDAERIAGWVRDEETFLDWGGDRFGAFPVTGQTIDEKYRLHNGDCAEKDNFYPWVALDESGGPVGHFIIRYLHGDRSILRFGWVVVDDAARGKGVGTEMLCAGLRLAFGIMGARKVTIGVYEDNTRAHACYLKAGFTDVRTEGDGTRKVIEMETTCSVRD